MTHTLERAPGSPCLEALARALKAIKQLGGIQAQVSSSLYTAVAPQESGLSECRGSLGFLTYNFLF